MNEKLELTEEEVNVYSDDCGKDVYKRQECIFEHIFYKAMVQILGYYLQQPIEIIREKLGVYIAVSYTHLTASSLNCLS